MKTLAVTGYKSHELGIFDQNHEGIHYIKKAFEKRLIPLIEEETEWFVISGQIGVELWVAEVVLQLKEIYPDIKLAVLTPFLKQEENWQEQTKEYYQHILSQADFVESITKRPYESRAQLRLKNEFIISKTDGLLLLYDEEKPGAPSYYLDVAKKRQEHDEYPILYITPNDLYTMIQEEREADPTYWSD
ncbi:DUF1273 domain-containing protein [Halalkalibacterium ligniniphilum]|uniref:DUF1273 domain-containing protein n=1 Tax=Halalkalibacterium ligniniphilum TaxID=1134413 RepID=UPI0003458890|nr:DUF1273 domain-containing protein [Halalkalibacterium ligniniphilum]